MTQAHKHGNTFPYYVVKLFFFNLFSKDHVSQERVLHIKNSSKRFTYNTYTYINVYSIFCTTADLMNALVDMISLIMISNSYVTLQLHYIRFPNCVTYKSYFRA